MVLVALKLRSDIFGKPTHQGLNVCKEDAIACVPESLHMFIRLMLGGQSLLENGLSDCDDDDKDGKSDVIDDDDDDESRRKAEFKTKCSRKKTRTSCGNKSVEHRTGSGVQCEWRPEMDTQTRWSWQ